VRAKGRRCRW